jgi:hypothetical protein
LWNDDTQLVEDFFSNLPKQSWESEQFRWARELSITSGRSCKSLMIIAKKQVIPGRKMIWFFHRSLGLPSNHIVFLMSFQLWLGKPAC